MLEKIIPKRLDIQVAIICGLMMIIAVPAYVFNEAQQEIDYMINTVRLETRAFARNIALTSSNFLVIRDYASLENLLIESASFPGVLGIQIADKKGNVVSDVINVNDEIEARFSVSELDLPETMESIVTMTQTGDELIIFEPIISGSNIGWVRLHYGLKSAQLHAESRFRDYLIDAAILAVVLIVLLILFLRRPMKMLNEAADFAGRISDKTGEKIPVCHQSIELNKLSVALNNASQKLYEQENVISQALRDLETQKLSLDEHSIVAITDAMGAITYANNKFVDVTGYDCDELKGVNLRVLNSGYHKPEFFKEMWSTISSGEIWRNEILNTNKAGKRIWLSASIIPFMDESKQPYQYVLICTDITPLKSAERQLERKNKSLEDLTDHLEDMVKQRTAELESANAELVHLNKVKSEFVSVVSHELRTPLTSIKSFAEILEDDIGEMDAATQRRYLQIINGESDRLGRLINDVLDLQKIDAGMMSWNNEVIDLDNLLRNSLNVFEHAIKAKGLAYSFVSDVNVSMIDADPDKVTQVVANILSNSIKFTQEGEISVRLSEKKSLNDNDEEIIWLETKISDTGYGIPDDELDDVFKRFHQVDSSETREQGGSGLGLNICKEIIEHYGGYIWAESTLGEGSCFCFRMRAKL